MNGLRNTIDEVALALDLNQVDLTVVGKGKAKVSLSALARERRGSGRLILVSAITPTPSGEGKTTVGIGLAMALCRLGRRAALCLRQPSLGPVFGIKGGGTGGGRATVEPSDDINLHFTGDLHAVSSAHNLLAALVDNDLHFRGVLDPRRITWPRVVDMNDRALRHVVIGLGGPNDGMPREARFDIAAASEVMAILCLASSFDDLRVRLGRIVVGRTKEGGPVTAEDLGATGAMHALLRDAFEPNLVQTIEGTPAFVHGGPFANIAHGTSSVVSTNLAMHYADDVVIEAGFGFDLGGEKFLDLACPAGGFWPRAVVLVATLRALVHHGSSNGEGGLRALERGISQIDHHARAVREFELEPIVALNTFADDAQADIDLVERHCKARGLLVARTTAHDEGSQGSLELARRVVEVLEARSAGTVAPAGPYAREDPFPEKLSKISKRMYGARSVVLSPEAEKDLERFSSWDFGALPPCVAKTPLSVSDDVSRRGTPTEFDLHVEAIRLSAGAGFLVALCGNVQTMPGLPREPAARRIHVDAEGRVVGISKDG